MSRIGKKPVPLPGNVKCNLAGAVLTIESGGKKLSINIRPEVGVAVDDKTKSVVVTRKSETALARAMHGTTRATIANMIKGVTEGFLKELEIVGVGWSGKLQGNKVVLAVGYADPKEVSVPAGVKVEINAMRIKVSGPDKQAVGQTAAEIRAQRPPEPYNGKGIKYIDEKITRKAGKAFAGGAA